MDRQIQYLCLSEHFLLISQERLILEIALKEYELCYQNRSQGAHVNALDQTRIGHDSVA
jgi:hypothetical protein